MNPKSALGGPKPIARTERSLLKNWSYAPNQCIYFSILLDWRSHLAKSLFILHRYLKFIKRADIKNCIGPTYKKPKPWKSSFIKKRFALCLFPELEMPNCLCGRVSLIWGMADFFYSHKTGSPPSKSLFLETVLPPTVEHLFASCTPLQLAWVASSKILLPLLLGHWYEIMALYYVKLILTEISASRQDRRVLQKNKIIGIKFLSIWGMLQTSRYV